MPIHTYAGFVRMTALCKTFVPKEIHEALEPIKVFIKKIDYICLFTNFFFKKLSTMMKL